MSWVVRLVVLLPAVAALAGLLLVRRRAVAAIVATGAAAVGLVLAVAEVDTFDHAALHGVRWPTRFHERLLRPLPLTVHDWRLTGLDVNRGLEIAEVDGAAFAGKAAAPAAPLTRRPA